MTLDSATTIADALDKRAKQVKTGKPKAKKAKAVKCHRPRRESTKTIATRLYSKWSEVVRAIAGNKCIVCGSTELLNAHHIIPRQICSGLRFSVENGACLCPSHHKFGKHSAHKNGLWFSEWLRAHDQERHMFCVDHMEDELDCSDRLALYRVELKLHNRYTHVLGNLDSFDVYGVLADGREIHGTVPGVYNAKAAETLFAAGWNTKGPERLKGITKVEKAK